MDKEVQISRTRILLYSSGTGVILFSVWTAIKTIILLFFQSDGLLPEFEKLENGWLLYMITVIFIMIITAGFTFLYIYIGRNACMTAKTLNLKRKYRFLTLIILILSIVSLMFEGQIIKSVSDYTLTFSEKVSNLVEIITDIILFQVLFYSHRLKKLLRKEG